MKHSVLDITQEAHCDFRELTEIKLAVKDTGIIMIGGGVPKNFTQDIVVATDILGEEKEAGESFQAFHEVKTSSAIS